MSTRLAQLRPLRCEAFNLTPPTACEQRPSDGSAKPCWHGSQARTIHHFACHSGRRVPPARNNMLVQRIPGLDQPPFEASAHPTSLSLLLALDPNCPVEALRSGTREKWWSPLRCSRMRLASLAEGAKSSSVLGRLHASRFFFAWKSTARTRTYRSYLVCPRDTTMCPRELHRQRISSALDGVQRVISGANTEVVPTASVRRSSLF